MRNNTIKCACLILFSLMISCTKTYYEVVETQECNMKHNYILVSTLDNSEANVEISYSIKGKDGKNVVLTDIYSTPVMLGGDDVNVSYNIERLIVQTGGKERPKESTNIINRNYSPTGSDYLTIKNLSSTSKLHFCIVANQSLTFYEPNELTGCNLNNINNVDRQSVININPSPIYKKTPILFLLKPELSPNKECYIISSKGTSSSIENVFAEKVILQPNHLGNVTQGIPYSINGVLDIYKDHYSGKNKSLFYNYSDMDSYQRGKNQDYFLGDKVTMYGVIEPLQEIKNNGQVWFLNTNLGYYGNNEF